MLKKFTVGFKSMGIAVVLMTLSMSLALPILARGPNEVAPGADTAADCSGVSCVQNAISAANGGTGSITINSSFGFTTIGQALNTIVSIIFLVAGLAAFVFILLGAFSYLTAGDDTAKVTKARTMITNAVVGLILVALVYVIWLVAVNLIPGMKQIFTPTTGTSG